MKKILISFLVTAFVFPLFSEDETVKQAGDFTMNINVPLSATKDGFMLEHELKVLRIQHMLPERSSGIAQFYVKYKDGMPEKAYGVISHIEFKNIRGDLSEWYSENTEKVFIRSSFFKANLIPGEISFPEIQKPEIVTPFEIPSSAEFSILNGKWFEKGIYSGSYPWVISGFSYTTDKGNVSEEKLWDAEPILSVAPISWYSKDDTFRYGVSVIRVSFDAENTYIKMNGKKESLLRQHGSEPKEVWFQVWYRQPLDTIRDLKDFLHNSNYFSSGEYKKKLEILRKKLEEVGQKYKEGKATLDDIGKVQEQIRDIELLIKP